MNCNIAQWCIDHPEANGFKSKNGYKWIKGQKYVLVTPYYGGTMNIMKMYEQDLPDELPDVSMCFDKKMAMELTKRYPIRWYDIEVANKFKELGKPLDILPFRSTIYVLGTGANISSNDPTKKNEKKKFHPIAFIRKINPFDKRLMTKRLKKEFGITL